MTNHKKKTAQQILRVAQYIVATEEEIWCINSITEADQYVE